MGLVDCDVERRRVDLVSKRVVGFWGRCNPTSIPSQGHGKVACSGHIPCGRERRRPDPPGPRSSRRRPGSSGGT